jgi:hypothetical protein
MNNLDIDIERSLYQVLNKFVLSVVPQANVYLAGSNFSAPKGPYIVVNVDSIDPVSWTSGGIYKELSEDETTIESSTYSTYVANIEIQCFGDGAMSRGLGIKNAFRDRSLRKLLSVNGVGYSSSSSVTDISRSIDNSKIEKASIFTVRVNFVLGGPDRGQLETTVASFEGVSGTYNP